MLCSHIQSLVVSIDTPESAGKATDEQGVEHDTIAPANDAQSCYPQVPCIDRLLILTFAVLATRCINECVAIDIPADLAKENYGPEAVCLHLMQAWVTRNFPDVQQEKRSAQLKCYDSIVNSKPD